MEQSDTVNIRVGRDHLERLRQVIRRHPLKPTMRAAIERAIELMIEDFEVEINNAQR